MVSFYNSRRMYHRKDTRDVRVSSVNFLDGATHPVGFHPFSRRVALRMARSSSFVFNFLAQVRATM